MVDLNFYLQAVIAMLLITFPPDPAKILLFNTVIEKQGKARTASALLVAGVVLVILVGATFFGRTLLDLMGINLDAFSAVGGLIIFGMGIGGLILATIGAQMMMGGIKNFFAA